MLKALRNKMESKRRSRNILWIPLVWAKDMAWKIKNILKGILGKSRDLTENRKLATDLYSEQSLRGLSLWGYAKMKRDLDSEGKLVIPLHIRNIKLDIGMSHSAPNSLMWLKNLDDRIVFGFEPNRENVRKLIQSESLKPYLNERFFIYSLAIDSGEPKIKSFYMTKEDSGTSSLYAPTRLAVKEVTKVPTLPLSDFLELIPWHRFPFIEHIKIDTQGNDLKVIKSAGPFLSERVVFVTAEFSTRGHYEHSHTESELDSYMKTRGFHILEGSKKGEDKTYLNTKFSEIAKKLDHSTV